jgi:Tetratricopeptide repeat
VVRLCARGTQAECEGRNDVARRLFERAWADRSGDDACIAAHYLARHQDSPHDTLRWNQVALQHADAVGDERGRGFYPSLYLNLGHAHEQLGHRDQAARYYELAADRAGQLPEIPTPTWCATRSPEGGSASARSPSRGPPRSVATT